MKNLHNIKDHSITTLKGFFGLFLILLFFGNGNINAQSFSQSNLNFNGLGSVSQGTSLMFGPDGRLYVLGIQGQIDILTIQRDGLDDYNVIAAEEILDIVNIPNHNDDGSSNTRNTREATGITVVGTPLNPIIYVTSSDSEVGGPSGDKDLDTNSGVITRLSWTGSSWDVVDIVRGLPRSEENHATNGLEFVTVNGTDYLIVCSGGHANAGAPSDNFAWTTEYALSAAMLSINLTMLEGMNIKIDSGRQYIYDIPTLDDPTRENVFPDGSPASEDPDSASYSPIDINDPWGGNDGLNQAMVVLNGPVQIFSPGYRNTYDVVITQDGKVYNTDNGANGGWGGLPENEGIDGTVTNNYNPSEIGSSSPTADGEQVNNQDHLTMITDDIQNYDFGSFYGGHPVPIRANPSGAGLFTNPEVNNYDPATSVWRTLIYDPSSPGAGFTDDPSIALPANWPPVPVSQANPVEGDWRGPGISNPDGPDDVLVTTWGTNTNGIDEYTASNFSGAMQGDLIAGKNGGVLRRVQLNADGSLQQLTNTFASNLGGNALGVTCNGDSDPFPGTIWVANFGGNDVVVLEPQDFVVCILPGESGYDANSDNDFDGYTNQDEIDNKTSEQTVEEVICNGGAQPNDFDKEAGGILVSDLNDGDDDNDGIPDASDPLQLGDPIDSGSDAFDLPVLNDLFSDQTDLKGYLGLGMTGLMNNGDANPNWLNWLDRRDDSNDPNPNDILGGAVGAMTMQMTSGTALGNSNNQEKGFQYGVNVSQAIGTFTIEGQLLNFTDPLQLYGNQAPANGELGIFLGDGTQSNYIKFVLNTSGVQILQEITDNAQTPIDVSVPSGNRPSNSAKLRFVVDPSDGSIIASYSFDGASFVQAGTLTAQGTILNAIQNGNAFLVVGFIGSSNENGAEVEGTWDYLNVQGGQPTIEQELPDLEVLVGASSINYDLDDYFNDDGGDNNLTYTVEENTNTDISTNISSNTLTIGFPSSSASGDITIRATDNDNLFIEQVFSVNVSEEPIPLIRIRANGENITDPSGPDWVGITATGEQSGTSNDIVYAVNTGSHSTQNITNKDASVPDYVPQAIFTNERFDVIGAPEMEWTFDLANGNYMVRLYMGNGFGGTSAVGERVFDISIEGQLVEDNLDLVSEFGHQVGGMKEYIVNLTDGTINILFEHVVENPLVNGIEILSLGDGYVPPINVDPIANQASFEGSLINLSVLASGGDPSETFSYSAIGLPSGIQIEPTTGLIFGTIASGAATASPYNSTVTVSKPSSTPVEIDFSWTVTGPSGFGQWTDQTDDENYTARHECSFVQAGDKFYLFGGRENPTTLDVYDYQSKTWSPISNSAPAEFNHFQAVEYNGLIWVIGAFKNNSFPNETPADFIWAYNPVTDAWIQGPEIPTDRKRGSAGLVVYNDKFYIIAGNKLGHNGQYVNLFDEFDPATGVWTELTDAPRPRDHFHAAVIGDKLYVAGGRLSGGTGGTFAPLIAEVDVYDFTSGTWSTLPVGQNLPTPRAAAAVGVLGGELYVIGGEIETDLDGNTINDAVKTTEAYNPNTNSWSTKADLLTERHGTQGIVSGTGIHVAAGSSTKGGGGKMKEMEYFNDDNPIGTVLQAGQLDIVSNASVPAGGATDITLSHVGGNMGILISDIAITGPSAAEFNIGTTPTYYLMSPGENSAITVNHTGTESGKIATMTITYDGNKTAVVSLISGNALQVVYRVNTGGPLTPTNDSEPIDWSEDQAVSNVNGTSVTGTPSAYLNLTPPVQDITFGAAFTGTNGTGYPNELFNTERYSTLENPDNMQWNFPVDNGNYTVNLIFAEIWSGAQSTGVRVFDVQIEGNTVLSNFDQTAAYGWNTAGVESFFVTVNDGNLNIDFIKDLQNPNVKGIEILNEGSDPIVDLIPIVVTSQISNQNNDEGDTPAGVSVDASGGDGGLNYVATGLPEGLTMNYVTGIIEGTIALGAANGGPNNDGDHFVTVTVDDADAVNTDAIIFNFSWIVLPITPPTGTILFRVNAGGPLLVSADGSSPNWSADTGDFDTTGNSPYLVANSAGGSTYTGGAGNAHPGSIATADPSLAAFPGIPDEVFNTERFDGTSAPEMLWQFPVAFGTEVEITLLFAELYSGVDQSGERVFDISVDGVVPAIFDDIDPFAIAGAKGAFVRSFTTVSDGMIDLEFIHGIENPALKGIQIRTTDGSGGTAPVVINPGTQFGVEGGTASLQVQAVGNTDCGPLEYSATGLPSSLSIDQNTGLISGMLDQGSGNGVSGAFIESNGLIIIEAETDFVDTAGGWNPVSDGGVDFLVASTNHFGNTNGQTVEYDLQISTPGVYRFHMKSDFTGTNPTEENDTWFKVENTPDVHFFCVENGALSNTQQFLNELNDNGSTTKVLYYPAGNAQGRPDHGNENPGNNGFFKLFRSGGGGNKWDSKTIDNNGFPVYAYFPNAGTYTLSMSERSAGHKIDRIGFTHIDIQGTGVPTGTLNGTPSNQNNSVVDGASENSPYTVTVTVEDACDPQESGTATFQWNVSETQSGTPSALVQISPGDDIGASTFGNGSFQITNTGDIDIVSVIMDISTSFLPDLVWDPVGTAGDSTAKCLVVGSEGGTGYIAPSDACVDPFSQFHNGVNVSEGYDIVTLSFNDFNNGETFTFSSDNDPTSIKNDQTAGSAGAVSGFELIGSSMVITFADGTILRSNMFDEGSLGGSEAIIVENTLSAPTISVQDVISPAVVPDLNQTILVQGTPNATVSLLQVDARLYIDSGSLGGPYDVDPFEANEAMAKVLHSLILDGSGNGSVPVTLLQTASSNAGPDGGINHFIAVEESGGQSGPTSNVVVLEYDPNAAFGDLEIAYTLQGRSDHSIDLEVNIYSLTDAETPIYTFTPLGTSEGTVSIADLEQGDYQVAVKSDKHLQRVLGNVTISSGTNAIDVGELLAGDANNDNVVSALDFSILATSFNLTMGDTNYDDRADFTGDGNVSALDFSLLATNFNTAGEEPTN